uniref:Fibronectin type III domain containing 4b n=1 Tax=Sinocyclocheilus rhinocerous TaxID=307959 RepID=A0A673KWT5_9TELE
MIHAGDLCFTDRPAAPVNVSVTHLRADSVTVSWNIPEGETVIGFAISQQVKDGLMQRFIREVNTTSRACILWDLDEDADYIIQVQSVGLYGESLASKKIHFRTLKMSEHIQSTMMDQGKHVYLSRHLQTGEILIIMTVLLMWAIYTFFFFSVYDIIKDNDSNNHSKEKSKPLSGQSTPEYHNGGLLGSKVRPSPLITYGFNQHVNMLFMHSEYIYQIKLCCILIQIYVNMSSLLVA